MTSLVTAQSLSYVGSSGALPSSAVWQVLPTTTAERHSPWATLVRAALSTPHPRPSSALWEQPVTPTPPTVRCHGNDLTLGVRVISTMVLFPFLGCTPMLFIVEYFLIFTIQDSEIKIHFVSIFHLVFFYRKKDSIWFTTKEIKINSESNQLIFKATCHRSEITRLMSNMILF